MRKKVIAIAIFALFLVAAMPSVAFAKSMFFTAAGSSVQTDPGAPVELGFPFPPGIAPAGILEALSPHAFALIAGGTSPETLGVTTLGQQFEGTVDSSDLPQLRNGGIAVTQNSWFRVDATTMGLIDGVAWGTFDLNRGNGNRLTGSYAAKLDGTVFPVAECVSAANPTGLFVSVTDVGGWEVTISHGSFKKVSEGQPEEYNSFFGTAIDGTLFVEASGCMGSEEASFRVNAKNK